MSESAWRMFGETNSAERWLVTTATGDPGYFNRWRELAYPSWSNYASRFGFGIAVAVSDLWEGTEPRLNGSWQKLLAMRSLRSTLGRDVRCAIIDTDVLISESALDVFQVVDPAHVGVVSQVKDIPLELERMNSRTAFLRAEFIDSTFPLSSLLNASPRQLFDIAGLNPAFDDFACAGVIIADTVTHAEVFAQWYEEAPLTPEYLSLGDWEQTYLNHRVQQLPEIQWLDYSWQALWQFEVAAHYPFLYSKNCGTEVAQWCLSATMMRNHFVHLAGRWESGLLRGRGPAFPEVSELSDFFQRLHQHETTSSVAIPRGRLLPPAN